MAGILITVGDDIREGHERARDFFIHEKNLKPACEDQDAGIRILKLSRKKSEDSGCREDRDTVIFTMGTLIYRGRINAEAIRLLQDDLKSSPLEDLTGFMDGPFCLVIRKRSEKGCRLVTDHAGIMNIYLYRSGTRAALSSSSMALSRTYPVTLNHEAVVQFLRTGNVYGSGTIYNEIELLKPASLYSIDETSEGRVRHLKQYWRSPVDVWHGVSFEDARDRLTKDLMKFFETVSKENMICDFTAGFDSRLIVSVLSKFRPFPDIRTFVFGPDGSREVQLVKDYCRHTGIVNDHLPLPHDWGERFPDYVKRALLVTDGEENAFTYAPILWAQEHKAAGSSCSVGGLGGEIYRDFWWIQEVFCTRRPANLDRLINMRVLQYEYDCSLFSRQWKPGMMNVKNLIKKTYLDALSDMDLENSYNTLQIDNLYFREKVRRWAGRTISSSNQIIAVLAPLTSKRCAETALSVPPGYKRNGRLVKSVIESLSLPLSELRMLNGAPCQNMSLYNAHRFAPLVVDFGKRGIRKAMQKTMNRTVLADRSVSYQPSSFFHHLLSSGSFQKEYDYLSLLTGKLYDPERYTAFLKNAAGDGFPFYSQLGNILTLEMRVRSDNIQGEG
jgi:hypothetical protein